MDLIGFLVFHLKIGEFDKLQAMFFSDWGNKRLYCYDRWKNFFNLSVKTNLKNNYLWKISSGEGDDYTTGCLLHYPYLKKFYRLIAIDLSEKQKVDADPRAIYFKFYNKVVLLKI